MYAPPRIADMMLTRVLAAVQCGGEGLRAALGEIPAPIYVTDADGVVTHFNRACINFAGRHPEPGQDRWCVTWRLYTQEGEFLPHAECPMAVAIQTQRPVRGVVAIAQRPDGTRVDFMPYPTPILAADGKMLCAVNMLIDITDRTRAKYLRAQALRCRRLALAADHQTIAILTAMAAEYEAQASALDPPEPSISSTL